MKSYHELELENEELRERNKKLREQLDEAIDLMQTYLPSRKEFDLWQTGSGRL